MFFQLLLRRLLQKQLVSNINTGCRYSSCMFLPGHTNSNPYTNRHSNSDTHTYIYTNSHAYNRDGV